MAGNIHPTALIAPDEKTFAYLAGRRFAPRDAKDVLHQPVQQADLIVDGRQVLLALSAIPIETWSFKTEDPAVRHIGPMAQDFKAAFTVGSDDKRINSLDADGVALAANQAEVRPQRVRIGQRVDRVARQIVRHTSGRVCLLTMHILDAPAVAGNGPFTARTPPRAPSPARPRSG